jgi:hypothetical protein
MSFWGKPTHKPKDKDVARFVEAIRTLTENQNPTRTLKIATSAFSAIVAFVVERFGPKEAIALLDTLRAEVMGGPQ